MANDAFKLDKEGIALLIGRLQELKTDFLAKGNHDYDKGFESILWTVDFSLEKVGTQTFSGFKEAVKFTSYHLPEPIRQTFMDYCTQSFQEAATMANGTGQKAARG